MPQLIQDTLVALTFPPALSLGLLLCGAIMALARRRRLAIAVSLLGIGWSLLWSIPWNAHWLRTTLERRHPVVDEANLPRADAVVVLGGGHYGRLVHRERIDPEALESSRLAAGARAWLTGRAPIIILSGGGTGGNGSEADTMAMVIVKMGVPASALILEERSADTRGNARQTAALARARGIDSILLVTSSVHMPRANLLFRDAGLDVTPVAVPERGLDDAWTARWLPSPSALWRSGRALKEYAGLMAAYAEGAMNVNLNRDDRRTETR